MTKQSKISIENIYNGIHISESSDVVVELVNLNFKQIGRWLSLQLNKLNSLIALSTVFSFEAIMQPDKFFIIKIIIFFFEKSVSENSSILNF